jgi:Holliday junction resolvasome RuvABC DNA-binding subunit
MVPSGKAAAACVPQESGQTRISFLTKGLRLAEGEASRLLLCFDSKNKKKTYSTVARAVAVGRHSAFRLLSAFSSGSLDAAVVLAARTVHLVKRPKGEGVGKDRERR